MHEKDYSGHQDLLLDMGWVGSTVMQDVGWCEKGGFDNEELSVNKVFF